MASPAQGPSFRGVLSPGQWQSDESTTICRLCKSEFTVFKRRHHCRGCGNIFHTECSTSAVLEQYGYSSPVLACFRCAAPFIAGVAPVSAPTGGCDAFITVYNVGSDAIDISAEIDGTPLRVDGINASGRAGATIQVTLPPGVGTAHAVIVTRKSLGLRSRPLLLSYAKPTLMRASSLPTSGGELVLMGDNFGADPAAIRVTVGGSSVAAESLTLKQPHHKLRILAPAGTGVVHVVVSVAGLESDPLELSHEPPLVSAVEPAEVDPTTGGILTLTGTNLGPIGSKVTVMLPDLGMSASDALVTVAHTQLQCSVPALPLGCAVTIGEKVRLVVVVDGVPATSNSGSGDGPTLPGFVYQNRKQPGAGNSRPGSSRLTSRTSAADAAAAAAASAAAAEAAAAVVAAAATLPPSQANAQNPYADLFTVVLPGEAPTHFRGNRSVTTATPGATRSSGTSLDAEGAGGDADDGVASVLEAATADVPAIATSATSNSLADAVVRSAMRRAAAVRVGGSLLGRGGPTLTPTPTTAWAPDAAECALCAEAFGLTRRKHHCRLCGELVCHPCSPHTMLLSSGKPPVRVCTRCNSRVELLAQMSAVIDGIARVRSALPPALYDAFKAEVSEAAAAVHQPISAAASLMSIQPPQLKVGSDGRGASAPLPLARSASAVIRGSVQSAASLDTPQTPLPAVSASIGSPGRNRDTPAKKQQPESIVKASANGEVGPTRLPPTMDVTSPGAGVLTPPEATRPAVASLPTPPPWSPKARALAAAAAAAASGAAGSKTAVGAAVDVTASPAPTTPQRAPPT